MRLVQLTIKSLTYIESGSQPLQVATHVLRIYRPFIYSSLIMRVVNTAKKKKIKVVDHITLLLYGSNYIMFTRD